MGNLGFEDRRIFLRFPASLPLHYININLNLKRKSHAHTCNIIANGIGLVTNEELLPHTPLDILLNIPDNFFRLGDDQQIIFVSVFVNILIAFVNGIHCFFVNPT